MVVPKSCAKIPPRMSHFGEAAPGCVEARGVLPAPPEGLTTFLAARGDTGVPALQRSRGNVSCEPRKTLFVLSPGVVSLLLLSVGAGAALRSGSRHRRVCPQALAAPAHK